MNYEYDVFVSYRRSPTMGPWVRNHLVPCLEARINEVSPRAIKISCDYDMEAGVLWPEELKRRLLCSGLLLAVWSADYFRSTWCMAEWESFKARERQLNLFSPQRPQGLVYPVRYNDGENYHPDAKLAQCKHDFSGLNYPYESFRRSESYNDFDRLVQKMATELVGLIQRLPPWAPNFPVADPDPMPAVEFSRPVLDLRPSAP